jgi:hypothetical protein
VALAVAPIVVAAASVIGRSWFASSDQGIELLRIADVGTRHTPLVGPWSRLGFSHPGPMLFWLLAPFDRLFGATGVLVGVGVINAAAVAGAVVLARRRHAAVLVALTVAVLLRATGLDLLVDPWNPWVPVLPFLLFLVAAWCVACADVGAVAVAVVAGSVCGQAHAGYAYEVVAVLVAALAIGLLRPADRRRLARGLVVGAAVGVVLWLPPMVEQLTSDSGNLSRIVDAARDSGEPVVGWRDAAGIAGSQLRIVGPWVTGDDPDRGGASTTGALAPALVVLAALGAVIVVRRRDRDVAAIAVLAIVAAAAGVLGTARIPGLLVPYLIRWWWVVAAVAAFAIVHAVVRDRGRGVALAATAALAAAAIVHAPAALQFERESKAIGAVIDDTEHALARDRVHLVRGVDPASLNAARVGLFVELERRGFDVALDPLRHAALTYGRWRLATEHDVDDIVTIVSDAAVADGWAPEPGHREIARGGGYAVYLGAS